MWGRFEVVLRITWETKKSELQKVIGTDYGKNDRKFCGIRNSGRNPFGICTLGPNMMMCQKMSAEWRDVFKTIKGKKAVQLQRVRLAQYAREQEANQRSRDALELMGYTQASTQPPPVPPQATLTPNHLSQYSDLIASLRLPHFLLPRQPNHQQGRRALQ